MIGREEVHWCKCTTEYIAPGMVLWSSVKGRRAQLPPCRARSASFASVVEYYAYSPRRKSHPRLHSILDNGMALHVEDIVRTIRQLRFITLVVSFEDQRVREHDVDFAHLLQAFITPSIGLDESLRQFDLPAKQSASFRLDPELLYARVPPTCLNFVLSFNGSEKTEKYGGIQDARGYCRNYPNGPL